MRDNFCSVCGHSWKKHILNSEDERICVKCGCNMSPEDDVKKEEEED